MVRNWQIFKSSGTVSGGTRGSGRVGAAASPTRGLEAAIDGLSEFTNLIEVTRRG